MDVKVKDVMTSEVIKVYQDATLQELVEMFIGNRLSGLPVIDKDNRLVGIVSKTDLVTHGLEKELSALLKEKTPRSSYVELPDFDNLLGSESIHATVADLMTTDVITTSPEMDVMEVIKIMLDKKIHRIVVVKEGKIEGILTTVDLVKLVGDILQKEKR
ncbi:MAG: CBS domain-containing protein [bacterium]|nr:CBS domain-containing protein [bacterium]